MKPCVVFDTNVLISGYLWNGSPRQAIQIAKSKGCSLLYCNESIEELIRVLSLKFKLSALEIGRVILDIKSRGKRIVVKSNDSPITDDPTDNLFINLAIDGNAKIIVSGDSHLLKLKEYGNISILSVAGFIASHN